jgi:sugar-specific transcriptional regulator TrmB
MTDDLEDALEGLATRFDFAEYEVKAYLTVLEHGELTASELAERADIPQPRVYDTVRDLADSGLVELRESRPMKVLAVDPEESFGDLQTSLDSLVERLESRYVAPARDAEGASLVKSRSTILRYVEEILEDAEYELLVSLDPELLDRYGEDLEWLREDGVAVDLLVSPAANIPDPAEYDYAAVADTVRARRGITTPIVAVADGSYALYATQDALRDDADRYGVIFNRSELGFLVSGFFNTVLWTTSETLASVDPRRPFPRRYTTIRRCVEELQDIEETLYTSIEARDIETGEHLTVEGTVVSVAFGTNREKATLVVESGGDIVNVGGQLASLEDVEAREIVVDTDEPPGFDRDG